jgi:TolA-binding protein
MEKKMISTSSRFFGRSSFVILLITLSGCMSARDGRVLQKDIFEVNTRLVGLENLLKQTDEKSSSTTKNSNLRQANSSTRVDRMQRDLQMIKGDIDALKIGVKTGKMPGSADEEQTVGLTLSRIEERLANLEETQAELITLLEKRRPRKGKAKKSSSPKSLNGVASFRKAFARKHYTQVVNNIGRAIKINKGNIKRELYYMEAESLFKLGKLSEAAIKFNKFIERYKSGSLASKSRMRMGDSFRHLGDHDTALIYYREALDGDLNRSERTAVKEKISKLKTKKAA